MVFVQDEAIRYASKQFRFTEKNLKAMLSGAKGHKKQLFADVLISLYYLKDNIIEKVKEGIEIYKMPYVDYLDESLICDFFDFKKNQLKGWDSSPKELLLKVLHSIAACYVTNREALLVMSKSSIRTLQSLAPKEFKTPTKEGCDNCGFAKGCHEVLM